MRTPSGWRVFSPSRAETAGMSTLAAGAGGGPHATSARTSGANSRDLERFDLRIGATRQGHDRTIGHVLPARRRRRLDAHRQARSIGVEIANFGNGFIAPFGNVEVHNMFNRNVLSYQLNNPKQPGNILPSSSRVFTQNIKAINSLGRYTVIASVSYGKGSQVLSVQKTIWYIPKWLAVLFVAVVGGLLYLAYRSWRRYQRDNKNTVRR